MRTPTAHCTFHSFRTLRVMAAWLLLILGRTAMGAHQTWDPNGAAAGTGGIGARDTSTALFNSGATTWSNGTNAADVADFGGTAGTVTLGTGVTAGGLQFDTSGYLITGNTLTFGAPFTITTNATTATVASILAGSNTLTTAGAGTLVLSGGSNSFTGNISVTAGVLSFTSDGNLGNVNNDPTITNNAVLRYAGNSTTLLNANRVITFGTGGGTIDVSDANGSLNLQSALLGSTLFDKTGAGTIVLGTASTRHGKHANRRRCCAHRQCHGAGDDRDDDHRQCWNARDRQHTDPCRRADFEQRSNASRRLRDEWLHIRRQSDHRQRRHGDARHGLRQQHLEHRQRFCQRRQLDCHPDDQHRECHFGRQSVPQFGQ